MTLDALGGAVLPTAAAAVAAGALVWPAPAVIAALPEPEQAAEDKTPYTELGRTRQLRHRLAVAAALAAGSVGAVLGWDPALAAWAYVCAVGVVLSFIDWRTSLLPFRLVAPSYGVVAGCVGFAALVARNAGLAERAAAGWLGAYALFALMWVVYRKGIGYGDVRLSGVLGMALALVGWPALLVGLYSGFLFGAVGGGLLALVGKVDRKGYPFGPFMVAGAWFGVVSGPLVSSWLG